MGDYSLILCFAREWAGYLEKHGHRVRQLSNSPEMLISRNGQGIRYRWLIRCVEGGSILLTVVDRKGIRRQMRLAQKYKELCFLVVKFGHPDGKAIVLPAAVAIKIKRLTSDRGGIPWDYKKSQ